MSKNETENTVNITVKQKQNKTKTGLTANKTHQGYMPKLDGASKNTDSCLLGLHSGRYVIFNLGSGNS